VEPLFSSAIAGTHVGEVGWTAEVPEDGDEGSRLFRVIPDPNGGEGSDNLAAGGIGTIAEATAGVEIAEPVDVADPENEIVGAL
jgi:hypothetical protein